MSRFEFQLGSRSASRRREFNVSWNRYEKSGLPTLQVRASYFEMAARCLQNTLSRHQRARTAKSIKNPHKLKKQSFLQISFRRRTQCFVGQLFGSCVPWLMQHVTIKCVASAVPVIQPLIEQHCPVVILRRSQITVKRQLSGNNPK